MTDDEVVIVEGQGDNRSGVEAVPAKPEDECLEIIRVDDMISKRQVE